MFKKGTERKIAVFATFAVVVLLGAMFVPVAKGRPNVREPLPKPKPGKRETIRKATGEIELLKNKYIRLNLDNDLREDLSVEGLNFLETVVKQLNDEIRQGTIEIKETPNNELKIERTSRFEEKHLKGSHSINMPIGGGGGSSSCGGETGYMSEPMSGIGNSRRITWMSSSRTQLYAHWAADEAISAIIGSLAGLISASLGIIMGFVWAWYSDGRFDKAANIDEGCGVVMVDRFRFGAYREHLRTFPQNWAPANAPWGCDC